MWHQVFHKHIGKHSWDYVENEKKTGGKYLAVNSKGEAAVTDVNHDLPGYAPAFDVGIGGPNDDLFYLDADNLGMENCYTVRDANGNGMPVYGCGNRIDVNANGKPIVVGGDYRVYNWVNGDWDPLTNMKAKGVAAGIDGSIYAIREDNEVVQWQEADREWLTLGTTAKSIAVAGEKLVMVDFHDNTFIANPISNETVDAPKPKNPWWT